MTCERPTPGGGGGATFLKTHSHVAKCYHSSVSFSFFYTTATTKQECDYKHESFGGGAPIALYHLCNLYTSSKKTKNDTRSDTESTMEWIVTNFEMTKQVRHFVTPWTCRLAIDKIYD